jgi:PKD domain
MRRDATTVNATPRRGTGAHARARGATLLLAALLASLLCAAPAGAAGWQSPVDISPAGQSALAPKVAANPSGTAVAVWTRSNGTNYIAQAAMRTPDGTWQAPTDISVAGRDAADAQVAIDPQGNAVATWQRMNTTSLVIQASVRPAGGTWGAPVDLSVPGWHAFGARVAMDAQGTAVLVWQRFDGAFSVIQSAVRPAGGSWQPTVNVSATGRDATAPAIAINPQGVAAAVWQRTDGTNVLIQGAMRPAGGSWQAPADISAAGSDAATPQVAVDPSGTAVAVWDRQKIVQSAVRPAGGAWQAPANLSIGCQLPTNPQVAVSPQGAAGAIWSCLVGSSPAVQTARRAAGAAWESAITLAPSGSAITPQIAFDPNGNTIAMWALAVRAVIQATTRPAGGAWQTPADLTAASQSATGPQLAVDGRGNAVAVWRRYNGSLFIAQGARYDGEAPVLNTVTVPETGLVGQQLAMSIAPIPGHPLGPTTWTFGDGATASGGSVSHAYARAGTFTVNVSTTDQFGRVTTTTRAIAITAPPVEGGGGEPGGGGPVGGGGGPVGGGGGTTTEPPPTTGTGTTPPPPPPPPPAVVAAGGPAPPPPATAPNLVWISPLDLSRSAFKPPRSGPTVMGSTSRSGTRVSYALNGAATVRFTVQRSSTGRNVGGRCVKQTSANRKSTSCKLYTAVRGTFTRSRPKGTDRFAFSGRLGGRALGAGSYRFVATPVAAGQAGKARLAPFRIVR